MAMNIWLMPYYQSAVSLQDVYMISSEHLDLECMLLGPSSHVMSQGGLSSDNFNRRSCAYVTCIALLRPRHAVCIAMLHFNILSCS